MQKKIRIIAEAGVNHNGDINKIYKLINIASKAKCDFVKFQITNASLISKYAPKANYQMITTDKKETQHEMIKKLEFDWDRLHPKLVNYCKTKNINFLTSAFDESALKQVDKLKLRLFKVPSGEITNYPYLDYLSKLNGEVLLSTGMSTLNEIERALKILMKNKKRKITLLHCNTAYPTPFEDANLNAIKTLQKEFNLPVGFSDHTLGIEASIAAVALGATVIEKHFTINRKLKGPDHKASLEPDELFNLTESIRNIEKSFGSGKKIVSKSEKENLNIARKSIVAKLEIKKGEKFSLSNLTVKRPGSGISPFKINQIIGKKSKFNFKKDQIIKL